LESPKQTDTSPARPLDAERARLRAAGLTDDEISRIFVARELGAQPQQAGAPAGTAGQGVMSGVLNNLNAVLAHARGVIPAIANQIVTLRDSSASASERITAALSLAVKAAIISVFGFAVWQEWRQHILYAPDISAAQLDRGRAEACSARVKAFLDSASRDTLLKGNAELARDCGQTYAAAVKGAINAAEIAAAQADKAKAEACIARIEAAAKNTTMSDFLNGGSNDALTRDCDPNYAQRESCDAKFKAIFAPLDTLKLGDPAVTAFNQTFKDRLAAHAAECPVTEAQKLYGSERVARFTGKITSATPDAPKPLMPTLSPAATEVIEMVCKGTFMNDLKGRTTIDYISTNGVKLISRDAKGEDSVFDNEHHSFPRAETDSYVKITPSLIAYGKKWTYPDRWTSLDYTISRVTGELATMFSSKSGTEKTVAGKCETLPATVKK
jgi:hypothetical protein